MTHTYDNNDTYTVTLTATDDDDASASTTAEVVVFNVAPVAFGQPVSTLEDTSIGITLVVDEPSTEDLNNLNFTITGPANGVLTGDPPEADLHPEIELLRRRQFHVLRA